MKLTVLGCGDAFGSDGRNNTSFAISNENKEVVLIDCGCTTLMRLKQEQIPLDAVSTIIVTHFHGDHYGGIPFLLISCLFEATRTKPLTITGPQGLRDKILSLQEIMYPGTAAKLLSLSLEFIEYKVGEVVNVRDKLLEPYRVEHSPESNPHGIRFIWEGKIFAFSGDTSMTSALVPLSMDADLFICECNYLSGTHFGHLSYEEILEIQEEFSCKRLWLSHMSDEVIHSNSIALNRLTDGQIIEY